MGLTSLRRLTIFAKGNLDVHDTLHSLELNGTMRWNGLNEAMRERGGGPTIRVRHETSLGSAAALAATGETPEVFAGRVLPLDPYPLSAQYGRALFEAPADAYVLSIQPDLQISAARHRRGGFLFYPNDYPNWSSADREWLFREFEPAPLPRVDEAMDSMEKLIAQLRSRSEAPILIYNVSSLVPGEWVHSHVGLEDIASSRIKQFNLELIGLSQRTGISIVDIDRIVAERGARTMKIDTTHLTEEGCRAVAFEVLRILENLGCIPAIED
jgi:hypothetical protein